MTRRARKKIDHIFEFLARFGFRNMGIIILSIPFITGFQTLRYAASLIPLIEDKTLAAIDFQILIGLTILLLLLPCLGYVADRIKNEAFENIEVF